MVTMRSPRAAASLAEVAAVAPSLTAAASEAGTTSQASTPKLFLSRFATIGWPMVPVPMNATFMRVSFPSGALSSRAVSSPSRARRLRGLVLIAAAAVSWGTTGSVTAVLVAHAGAGELVIGAARMAVAAVLLVALARWAGGPVRIAAADRWRCVALGVCMAAFQATYFSAVTRVGIAMAALIAICGAPLLIAALAAAFLGERPTARSAVALAFGVAGTALLVAGPRTAGGDPARFAWGVLLAIGASLSYAV